SPRSKRPGVWVCLISRHVLSAKRKQFKFARSISRVATKLLAMRFTWGGQMDPTQRGRLSKLWRKWEAAPNDLTEPSPKMAWSGAPTYTEFLTRPRFGANS